jgi:hypothetical protein
MSTDPLAADFTSWSPYNYVLGNPVMFIDPDGRSASPIYDMDGIYLGTDDQGSNGEAIVMEKSQFSQGMSHDKATEIGTAASEACASDCISTEASERISSHYDTRPEVHAEVPNETDYLNREFIDMADGTSKMLYDNKWIPAMTEAEYAARKVETAGRQRPTTSRGASAIGRYEIESARTAALYGAAGGAEGAAAVEKLARGKARRPNPYAMIAAAIMNAYKASYSINQRMEAHDKVVRSKRQ